MTDIIYHSVKPSNALSSGAGFSEYNTLDFNLVANGRKMVAGSVRICAQVEVTTAPNTQLVAGNVVRIDPNVGAHAFFESFQCEISQGPKAQVLENLASYPRFVSMADAVSRNEIDVCDAALLGELRGATEENGTTNLQQVGALSEQSTARNALTTPSFSIKPMLCFNRMIGDNYSFNANGSVRISCNLARSAHALYGYSCQNGTCSYSLKNVRLTYVSVPDDGKQGKMMMDTYAFIKSNMISSQANVQARVPARAVKSCSISVMAQAHESSLVENSYGLERLPQLSELNFSFQDTLTNYITYTIDDLQDALTRGVESFPGGQAHNNACNPNQQAANRGYILGTDFDGQVVDLSGQKFGVSIKSDFLNMGQDPRLLFLYFHSQIML